MHKIQQNPKVMEVYLEEEVKDVLKVDNLCACYGKALF